METNCLSLVLPIILIMKDGEIVKSEPCLDAQAKK